MSVEKSLLNPPSETEKVQVLESKGERMMFSYSRVRTHMAALRISLPSVLEQSVTVDRVYQEVENADPNDAPADYSRKLGKLQRLMEALESGFADSESVQIEGQSRQTTQCDAQLSLMLSG
jgi:hypothetical protein